MTATAPTPAAPDRPRTTQPTPARKVRGPVTLALAMRMWRSTDARLLFKFAWNFGYKGMRSVQRFKKRLKKGQVFPPFLYISITNTCNLRCTGCWVDVAHEKSHISFEDLDRLITNAKKHGNRFFGM